jgi:hypothetical protein
VEKLNYSFVFESLEPVENPGSLKTGFYIWVWHVDKIPPHIGCSFDGHYYALKVQSKDMSIPVESVFSLILRKGIPSFFIQVNSENGISLNQIHQVFTEEPLLSSGLNSCTTPINKLFNCPDNFQLSELLDYLSTSMAIHKTFAIHRSTQQIGILTYSKQEIVDRIKLLTDAKRKTRLP